MSPIALLRNQAQAFIGLVDVSLPVISHVIQEPPGNDGLEKLLLCRDDLGLERAGL